MKALYVMLLAAYILKSQTDDNAVILTLLKIAAPFYAPCSAFIHFPTLNSALQRNENKQLTRDNLLHRTTTRVYV